MQLHLPVPALVASLLQALLWTPPLAAMACTTWMERERMWRCWQEARRLLQQAALPTTMAASLLPWYGMAVRQAALCLWADTVAASRVQCLSPLQRLLRLQPAWRALAARQGLAGAR